MPDYDILYDSMDKFVLIGIDLKNNLQQDRLAILFFIVTFN